MHGWPVRRRCPQYARVLRSQAGQRHRRFRESCLLEPEKPFLCAQLSSLYIAVMGPIWTLAPKARDEAREMEPCPRIQRGKGERVKAKTRYGASQKPHRNRYTERE